VSPTTEKIYSDDWNAFRNWCLDHRAPYLPAPPAIVAAYLAERATTLGRSGLRLVLAAIAFHHRRAGHLWSSGDPVIATVKRGILREQKRPVRPAAAITSTEICLLLSGCGDDPGGAAGLPGLRDRALLLACFAGGLRRSELVALDREDTRFTPGGLVLRIRQSKGDQEGEGAEVGIARGSRAHTCPVRAMEIWLRRAGITYGAVFPRLTAAGTNEGRLTGNGVWKILRRLAAEVDMAVDDGASVTAWYAGGLHHRGLSERRARRASHGACPAEGCQHHAALSQTRENRRRQPDQAAGCLTMTEAPADPHARGSNSFARGAGRAGTAANRLAAA
jgi:integrase